MHIASMPAKGSPLDDVAPDIAAMHWTHEMARELGAPDLKEPSVFAHAASGKHEESDLSRSAAFARTLARQAIAGESLRRRPVDGYFIRCGHQKIEANIYTDAKGERCRVCRNEKRRTLKAAA